MGKIIEKLEIIYSLIVCDQYAFYSIRKNRVNYNKHNRLSILCGDRCIISDNASKLFLETISEYTNKICKEKSNK